MAALSKEKRRDKRIEAQALVRFEGEGFVIYSRSTDQSRFGLFVATNYLLDAGSNIRVYLTDAQGNEASTIARVVHSTTPKYLDGSSVFGLGLEFLPKPHV